MSKQVRDPGQRPRTDAGKRVVSMHENVEVWQDCCCCEAEPYWLEAMAQHGEDAAEDRDPDDDG